MANGGIGVSYSNVVLGGGLNPREQSPVSAKNQRPNFVNQSNMTTAQAMQAAERTPNAMISKYTSARPIGGGSLVHAASQVLIK